MTYLPCSFQNLVTYTEGIVKCLHVVVFLVWYLWLFNIGVGFCKHRLVNVFIFATWSSVVKDSPDRLCGTGLPFIWLPASSNGLAGSLLHIMWKGVTLVEDCFGICTENNTPSNITWAIAEFHKHFYDCNLPFFKSATQLVHFLWMVTIYYMVVHSC